MEYTYTKPERRFRGPVHWGHRIDLIVKPERKDELTSFLNEVVGENNWRLRSLAKERPKSKFAWVWWMDPKRDLHRLKFLSKDHVIRVKLMWDECIPQKPDFKFPTPLPSVGAGFGSGYSKTYLNTLFGSLSSGKSSGIEPMYKVLKAREVTETAKKMQEVYFDYEAGFLDFDSVRAKGAPIGSNPCNEIPLGPTSA